MSEMYENNINIERLCDEKAELKKLLENEIKKSDLLKEFLQDALIKLRKNEAWFAENNVKI